MYLNHEEIKQLEEYGELLMLPVDVATILELNEKEFISELNDFDSKLRKIYYKGILKTEVKIRKKAVGKNHTEGETDFLGNQIQDGFIDDIESVNFSIKDLNDFKAKLIIQLDA